MQHVHTWRQQAVRVGLNAQEREFWEQLAEAYRREITYKYCACGAVLL